MGVVSVYIFFIFLRSLKEGIGEWESLFLMFILQMVEMLFLKVGERYLILSANKVRTKYAIAMICLMIQGFGLDDLKVENSKM